MKIILIGISALSLWTTASNAQVSNGGLPLCMVSRDALITAQSLPTTSYDAPSLENVMAEDAKATMINPKPYRAGILVPTDFSFPSSGTMVTLADGHKVWRGQLSVANAPAVALYYDQFSLPNGVNYYITNANGKQILGAYTEANNSADGKFATQELQGNVANVEIDMDQYVDPTTIKFHINRVAYIYRSYEYLNHYADNTDGSVSPKPTADQWEGGSSVCEINAMCPQAANYANQRNAVARSVFTQGNYYYFCSGSIINNTKGDCTPYYITATHCEATNSKVSSTYSQWMFYFNFQNSTCSGLLSAPNSQTVTGASFVARADYVPKDSAYPNGVINTQGAIIGDFLLLKLNTTSAVLAGYGAYFEGWNLNTVLPSPSTYYNFSHPSGDVKKFASGTTLTSGEFNQDSVLNTHWDITFTVGGIEEGSSGSPLFDVNGLFVGDLTGGPQINVCPADTNKNGQQEDMYNQAQFSKFCRNWQYPQGNGATNAQLATWLDPSNTGAKTIPGLAAATTCNSPIGNGITNNNATLGNAISIYPNPVVNGIVHMKINLDKTSNLTVTFYDITGARKAVYNLNQVISGDYAFDMSGYADGTYLISINNGEAITSKKIMLVR